MGAIGRSILKSITPPVLVNAARGLKRMVSPGMAVWEIVPGGWDAVRKRKEIRGWNVRSAADASAMRVETFFTANLADRLPFGLTPATVDGPAPGIEFHNTAESFVHSFLSSTRMLPRASILDWGGGVGHYSSICRMVAPDLELDYHCCELPEFTRLGRELYTSVTFHEDDSWRSQRYDFVFASGSLHYVEDWKPLLRALAVAAAGRRLFVTRVPTVFHSQSYVFVQRPHAWGFDTEYAAWCFNRQEFLEVTAQLGLRRVWEFVTGEKAEVTGAPEVGEYRGFLFDVPADLK